MVWVGAFEKDLASPIIFNLDERLSHENYTEVILPHAQSEGTRMLEATVSFPSKRMLH